MMRVDLGDLVYFRQPEQFGKGQLVWATFSRLGGVSDGAFASLNVGYHVGDDGRYVAANRGLIADALSFPAGHLVAAQQVHNSAVAVVDETHRGRGALTREGALPQTDAMITATRQTFLLMTVADCAALTVYDPIRRAVGIAHCGWRGMVAKLGLKTIETMRQVLGCRPDDLRMIVSPSIGPCCYEVGEMVLAPLRATYSNWHEVLRVSGHKTYLDLWQMARRQALDGGIKAENVFVAEMCTACNTSLFYSHRAEGGHTGRFAVIAGLS